MEDFLKFWAVYTYNTYYYPPGTMPLRSQTMLFLILLLISFLPVAIPLVYYAFKLQGFTKHSKMWKPWKKFALGWLLLVMAIITGITEFSLMIVMEVLKQRYITWLGIGIIISPLMIFTFITIFLTIRGIQQFYRSATISVYPQKEIGKLRYILVIHRKVGATIYDKKLGDWELDSDLIGGFLGVIQEFSSEIKKVREPMRKMEYKNFEIILEQGKYAIFALFIDGVESYWLREKLTLFSRDFEKE
ncbi:MAG: hypothetical protein HWN67_12075, partial [Candidatus Helarchaeota archaeon]|nr:hypothetical protein [Candidatus Helarchaeota archaeon]